MLSLEDTGQMQSELGVRKEQLIEDAVTAISLEWLTGEIRILTSETNHVRIIQYTSSRFSEKKLVEVELQAEKLRIVDGRRKHSRIGFNIHTTVLEVYLPKKKLHSFSMHGVGSHVFVQDLEAAVSRFRLTSSHATISGKYEECEIYAIGSHYTAEDTVIDRLNLRSTSSKVEISGEVSQINTNATGRGIHIHSTVMPKEIQSVSTGANVTVAIPDHEGFVLEFKKVSGQFKSDFSITSQGSNYTYKNGGRSYRAEVRGGQFFLRKI
ncbi:hypothetical protein D3C78_805580 [compost metagenome]